MDKKDFQDLLNEIDSMSVEEYNNFHEKALKLKCQIQNLEEENKRLNEWHDLQLNPNDLPKENMKQVMVITNYNECLMGWYCIHQKTWWDNECPDPQDRIEQDNIKVIKWKEIVLPKESE